MRGKAQAIPQVKVIRSLKIAFVVAVKFVTLVNKQKNQI